jgi:rubredoxin
MGCLYRFECSGCGYQAEVSGGPDVGMLVETQPVFCLPCNELRDVATGCWGDNGLTPEVLRRRGLDAQGLSRCGVCGGREHRPWRDGDRCPRCGGKVHRRECTLDWD